MESCKAIKYTKFSPTFSFMQNFRCFQVAYIVFIPTCSNKITASISLKSGQLCNLDWSNEVHTNSRADMPEGWSSLVERACKVDSKNNAEGNRKIVSWHR